MCKGKKLVAEVLSAVLGLSLVVGFASCHAGCISQAEAYSADVANCVVQAKTKAEADACRDAVDKRYGVCKQPDGRRSPCPEGE